MGRNLMGYSNPKVDELFEAGEREIDLKKRAQIYHDVQALLVEDVPALWLWDRISVFAQRARVKGHDRRRRPPRELRGRLGRRTANSRPAGGHRREADGPAAAYPPSAVAASGIHQEPACSFRASPTRAA